MAYKFIVRQAMPEFFMGDTDYPVMNACIEFLQGIHDGDQTFDDIPSFVDALHRYPHFLREKDITVTDREARTNPTPVETFGLDGAYSIIVVSELSYVPRNICWLGNLVPEDMMDEFYEWVEIKEKTAKSMMSNRAASKGIK